MPKAVTNAPYANRVQLKLTPLVGPFTQDGPLADFDPRRDLEVYVDGARQTIQTFAFDALNNRYLLYMASTFNLRGVVQVVHHIPSPFFSGSASPIAQRFKATGTVSGGGSFSIPIPNDLTAGNQLLLAVEIAGVNPQPSVNDSLSLPWDVVSYQIGAGPPIDNRTLSVWATPVRSGGSDIITVTEAGSFDWCVIGIELQGVSSIITTSPVNNTGTSAGWSSVPITVSQESLLIALDVGYGPPTAIADAFQLLDAQLVGAPPVQLDVATRTVAAGTYTSAWTQAAPNEWQTVLVGYNINPPVLPGFAIIAQFSPNGDNIGWGLGWGEAWGQS